MDECEVRENCKNYGKCEICEYYGLYWPENPSILCERQAKEREERKAEKKRQKATEAAKRGRQAKRKGREGEKQVEKELNKYGLEAYRVPLSGALKGRFSGDVKCKIGGVEKKIEVKRRKDGFKELYKFLEQDNSDMVFARADRKGWLVIMPVEQLISLLPGKE